ncbi:MAG: precorrin-6A reductase [Firmicutes bacterium]|nr:precorrin-6A reductase [Bacillota bacterium]
MILLMGGTKDARQLAATIAKAYPDVKMVATVVSAYGAELLQRQGNCEVITQAMDAVQLVQFIRKRQIKVLIDATHPFARRATEVAREAAATTNITYLRYERPASEIKEEEGVYFAEDFPTAAKLAARLGRVAFLTIGTRHLAACLPVFSPEHEVIVRVLPDVDSLQHCASLGIKPGHIVAMQGPFSQALNEVLWREYKAEVVLTKDSGTTGGTREKVAAAKACQIPIVIVKRPPRQSESLTGEQIMAELKKLLTKGMSG